MNKTLVVSDTNIFIDLISIDLLDSFFELPFSISTTDFVINELTDKTQRKIVENYIYQNVLTIKSFSIEEVIKISDLQNSCNTNASIPDCSVWYLAKETDSLLLTGDNKLRKVCEADNIHVAGILFIMDKLVELGICKKNTIAKKLSNLLTINSRLPHSECEKRLKLWKKDRKILQ